MEQTEPFADITVYDRGSRFDFGPMARRFPGVRFSRPEVQPSLSENFTRVFRDPPAQPWLCVFHDDDRFKPDFCRNMAQALQARPECGAISCDGEVINGAGQIQGGLLPNFRGEALLRTPGDLAQWYCDSFIPFPATVYPWHARLAEWIAWAEGYGRCGDVALYSKIIREQPIWIRAAKDFFYRRHGGQDSTGFVWWEETKRWDLQLELARNEPGALAKVVRKRKARLTQRWFNAWLAGEARPERLRGGDFSLDACHRFARNNKLRIFRRLLGFASKAPAPA